MGIKWNGEIDITKIKQDEMWNTFYMIGVQPNLHSFSLSPSVFHDLSFVLYLSRASAVLNTKSPSNPVSVLSPLFFFFFFFFFVSLCRLMCEVRQERLKSHHCVLKSKLKCILSALLSPICCSDYWISLSFFAVWGYLNIWASEDWDTVFVSTMYLKVAAQD